jgi:hypothetical protein
MAKSKLLTSMSPKCRSYQVLSDLDRNQKIKTLSKHASDKIESNLEKKFVEIKEIYVTQEKKVKQFLRNTNGYL